MKIEIKSIIDRINSGDDAAFTELCREYDPLIRSMSAKYARVADVSNEARIFEDFSQEATLALYRAAGTYKSDNGQVSFGLYAKVCIRNALVSELRRMNRKKKADRVHEKELEANLKRQNSRMPAGVGVIDLDSIAGGELLSPFEKKVFVMYARGMKIRDIAAAVGRSSKSVSNAVYRIKSKLRLSLDEMQ